jgi:prepilin-type N-terminal cleavage/methylation domain-containing protein
MYLERRHRDEGFTLIELLMTIAILSIISVALVGVLLAYLRNANQTNTRLNESSDQQFISAFWQQDVSSVGIHSAPTSGGAINTTSSIWLTGDAAPSGVPGACASPSTPAGSSGSPTTVIGFAWNDYQTADATDGTKTWTTATINAAVYFTIPVTNANGTSQVQLWRTRCNGSTSQTNILARYLTATPVATCSTTCESATLPATVSLPITVQDRSLADQTGTGYTSTLTAERRQG